MATARDIGVADVAFIADVDLTAGQYYAVTGASTANKVALATGGSNPAPLGVLQNSPSAGQEARVRMFGPNKLFVKTPSGSALNLWSYVTVNASGQGIPLATDGGSPIFGRNIGATVAVSACRYAEVFIWPFASCAMSAS